MDYGLVGKKALVLGASRGLGAASAALLAEEGADVLALSRSGATPAPLSAKSAARLKGRALDLTDRDALDRFCAEAPGLRFDILVNNCGGPSPGTVRAQNRANWEAAFTAVALPIFQITDAVLPGMEQNGWGRVVTIGSSGIEAPIPAMALSNVARASVAAWSKTLAAEVASKGVTVNLVLPGRIATDRVGELDRIRAEKAGKPLEEIRTASLARIPAARYGRPEEFSAAVVFLCSNGAGFITGSMLRVDGGMIPSL